MDSPDMHWVEEVCAWCDPVFAAAGVGFVRQVQHDARGVAALLWEADPSAFIARYPDSGVEESYGDQWPGVSGIDWWAYVDAEAAVLSIDVEGWSVPRLMLDLTGRGGLDGMQLAGAFARLLGVAVKPPTSG